MRKVALGVSLLTLAAPTVSLGLGLGDIKVESALNQPLRAQIQVLSLPPKELDGVKVRLAPRDAFARVGIERASGLSELRFSVAMGGNGHPVITVTSTRPVKEPFLDFLVQVEWPKGQLLREYTILLDPPVVMNQPSTASVQAPATGRAPMSAPVGMPSRAEASTRGASVQGMRAPGAKGGRVETDFGTQWGAAGNQKRGVGSSSYHVRKGDTLGEISGQYRPHAGATLQQTMLAFLRKNPDAFIDNNVNNLKAGYVLRIPSRNEVFGIDRTAAAAELARQTALWHEYRQRLAQHLAQPGPSAADMAVDGQTGVPQGAATDAESRARPHEQQDLKILATEGAEEGQGAAQGGETAEVQGQLALTRELIENQRQENAELRERVAELEKMLAQQDRIINLQSTQLAELQQVLTQGSEAEAPVTPVADPAPQTAVVPSETVDAPVSTQQTEPSMPEDAGTTPSDEAPVRPSEQEGETTLVEAPAQPAEQEGETTLVEAPAQPAELKGETTLVEAPAEVFEGQGGTNPMEAPEQITLDQTEIALAQAPEGALSEQDGAVLGETPAADAMARGGTALTETPEGQDTPTPSQDSATGEGTDPEQLVDEAFAEMEAMDAAWAGDTAPEAPAPPVEEPPPAAEPQPADMAQSAEDSPASAVVPPVWASFIDEILSNPVALAAMGGTGILALALVGMVVARSRRKSVEDDAVAEEAVEEVPAAVDDDEEEVLEAAVAEAQPAQPEPQAPESEAEVDEVAQVSAEEEPEDEPAAKPGDDVIAEADVYIAYGMYGQAEELLKQALEEHPGVTEYRAKLLETYYGAEDNAEFETEARELQARGPDADQWQRVAAMGRELDPNNPLYQEDAAAEQASQDLPEGEAGGKGTLVATAGAVAGAVAAEALVVDPELASDGAEQVPVPELERDVVSEPPPNLPDPALEEALLAPAAEESESDGMLEFDVEDLDIGTKDTDEAVADESEEDATDATALDFDLSDLDIELSEEVAPDEVEVGGLEIDLAADEPDSEGDIVDLDDLVVDTDGPEPGAEMDSEVLGEDDPDAVLTIPESDEPASSAALETLEVSGEALTGLEQDDGQVATGLDPELEGDAGALADTVVVDVGEDAVELGGDALSSEVDPSLDQAPDEVAESEGLEVMPADGGSEAEAEAEAEQPGDEAAFLDDLLSEDLGMEDLDEDAFLNSDDEVGTKLDLARAYLDMGDQEGARSTLEEVMHEGDDTQRREAENLLRQIA